MIHFIGGSGNQVTVFTENASRIGRAIPDYLAAKRAIAEAGGALLFVDAPHSQINPFSKFGVTGQTKPQARFIMTNISNQAAVVYCRVSSIKQTIVGTGLDSQEQRCREFARMKNYAVVEVFRDDVSGSLIDRPGMTAMLAYIRKNKKSGSTVVLIDDVSRLARGLNAHLELRAAIAKAGGILEFPSIEFGEDPDSRLSKTSWRRLPSTSAARTASRRKTACARA